jgi:hypothetical protein
VLERLDLSEDELVWQPKLPPLAAMLHPWPMLFLLLVK